VKSDNTIKNYTRQIEENPPGEKQLETMKNAYQKSLVMDLFDFSPLQRRLGFLLKLLREHIASIDTRLIEVLNRMDQALKIEMVEVSDKFIKQVHRLISENPNVENNMLLQERIMKACLYFAPKIETVLEALPESDIVTDNKSVRKSLQEAMKRFRTDVFVKQTCLKACEKDFKPTRYLQTRAKAAIEPPKEKKAGEITQTFAPSTHPEFYVLIKSWRDRTAETLDMPEHMLLRRRTMLEIADQLPATWKALLKIKGVGEKKAKRFGAEILEMTMTFRKKNNMELPCEEPAPAKSNTLVKGESQRLSFELFLSGKNIAEIAAERKMTVGTIEGHLSFFVGTGQLQVEKLIPTEKISRISDYFVQADSTWLGSAKAALGDAVSFGEIKCVLKHLEYLKTRKND
jgi:hypothetical protein